MAEFIFDDIPVETYVDGLMVDLSPEEIAKNITQEEFDEIQRIFNSDGDLRTLTNIAKEIRDTVDKYGLDWLNRWLEAEGIEINYVRS